MEVFGSHANVIASERQPEWIPSSYSFSALYQVPGHFSEFMIKYMVCDSVFFLWCTHRIDCKPQEGRNSAALFIIQHQTLLDTE